MSDVQDRDTGRRKGSLLAFAPRDADADRVPEATRPALDQTVPGDARRRAYAAEGQANGFADVPVEPEPASGRKRAGASATPASDTAGSASIPQDDGNARGLLSRLRDRLTGWRWSKSPASGNYEPSSAEAPRPAPAPRRDDVPVVARDVRHQANASDNPYWKPLIDPVTVISGILAARYWIVVATIIGGLVGVVVALNTPKLYEATTELIVDPRNLNIVERELSRDGLPSDAILAIVENQIRIMESGTVIDRVVEQLSLDKDPEFNGEGGGFSITGLVANLRGLLSPSDRPTSDRVRQSNAVGNLYEALTIERGAKTFVITIRARTQDPDKSALIANTVVRVFLQTYGELQSGTAVRATEELTSRLDDLRAEVQQAERAVENFKAENEIIDPQGRLITDDEIVKLNEQLSVARARTIELNARADSVRELGVDDVVGGSLPEEIQSGLMTELRAQYSSLAQEADRLAVRLGPRHPRRLDIEAQLRGARDQIRAEIRRINQSIQVDLRRAVQLEQDLASRLAQLKVRHGNVGDDMVTLRELERDAASKRAVYESFLLRARETGQQQSLNTANVSVISEAHPPLLPVGPSRSAIAIGFALLGFALGVAFGAASGTWRSLRENGFGLDGPGQRRDWDPDDHRDDTPPLGGTAPARGQSTSAGETWQESAAMRPAHAMHPAHGGERDRHSTGHGGPHAWPGDRAVQHSRPHYHPTEAWQDHAPPHPRAHAAPAGWAPVSHHGTMHAQAFAEPYVASQPPGEREPPHLSVISNDDDADDISDMDEIQRNLRELREAIQDLTESRRRRVF